ncbi:NUDIX domain-containing protein [Mycolicibacterium sp. 624]|uniref:NUDIX hydrolase n=1 Tax=Mycolicibacterium sp. 624 TaxID=3156314 RepID=UPI003391525D
MTDTNPGQVIRVAAAVIVDADDRVLLVRKRGTTTFMQPGGKIMSGETATEAVRREVTEELGVAASETQQLGRHIAEAANEPGHLVDAELFLVSVEGQPYAAAEIDEIAWVDLAAPGDIELAPLTRVNVRDLLRR